MTQHSVFQVARPMDAVEDDAAQTRDHPNVNQHEGESGRFWVVPSTLSVSPSAFCHHGSSPFACPPARWLQGLALGSATPRLPLSGLTGPASIFLVAVFPVRWHRAAFLFNRNFQSYLPKNAPMNGAFFASFQKTGLPKLLTGLTRGSSVISCWPNPLSPGIKELTLL